MNTLSQKTTGEMRRKFVDETKLDTVLSQKERVAASVS